MSNNGSRFHIEVTNIKAEDEMSVRFNIFGDTFAQVTADLEKVIAYVTGSAPLLSKSPRPVVNGAAGAAVLPPAPKPPPPPAKVGACVNCGSDALEWVTGTRKDNGKPFAAYKCQECGKWQPEAR
ncbi:MAG: hypothetical protein WC169_05510 [Dehalococcoidia bacterium]|jgi:hypothetical protein